MSFVYPPRALGSGEHWGRTVEGRLEDVADFQESVKGKQSGNNRYSASSAQTLSRNAETLQGITEALETAILTFPQYFTANDSNTGFSVEDSWTTVCSLTIPRPSGFDFLDIVAQGNTSVSVRGTSGTSYIWPFSLSTVTSEFGPRPPLPFHNGIDFGVGTGTRIPASADGTIILKGYYEDWGNYIRIGHASQGSTTIWTGYAHMRELPSYWSVGDSIQQDDRVGYVGATGLVTGPHLHWETAVNGTRIDPRTFMSTYGQSGQAEASDVRARLVIAGNATPPFRAATNGSRYNSHLALGGESLSVSGSVSVQLQLRGSFSPPPDSLNTALLTVTGGFS